MRRDRLSRVSIAFALTSLLLCGCGTSLPRPTPTWTPTPTRTLTWTPTPAGTPDPTEEFLRYCYGWNCSLKGVVYVGTARPGNELEGIAVRLSKHSYCSPIIGELETTTGADGRFRFWVYVHDTDTFWIQVELAGYEPVRQSIGGMDCLYCSCPPIEIVLQPVE